MFTMQVMFSHVIWSHSNDTLLWSALYIIYSYKLFLFHRCGYDEKLECEPQPCEPQPMMQKMLAIRR